MTLFNLDPYRHDDIDLLRAVIVDLQLMVRCLQRMDESSRNMGDLLYRVNNSQGDQIELLKARIKTLEEGVANNRPELTLRRN